MAEMVVPIVLGFLSALLILFIVRTIRRRSAPPQPIAPEVPVSRQHRRALERRAGKGR